MLSWAIDESKADIPGLPPDEVDFFLGAGAGDTQPLELLDEEDEDDGGNLSADNGGAETLDALFEIILFISGFVVLPRGTVDEPGLEEPDELEPEPILSGNFL